MSAWQLSGYVLLLAANGATFLALAYLARDITFLSVGSDSEKQSRAAATFSEWKWPSDMHKFGGGKTRAKDAFVLALACVQRIVRKRDGDYPAVVLCIAANFVSTILIFNIGTSYWGIWSGLFVTALFLVCLWPHWIASFGGHVSVAQTFFLTSIVLIQQSAMRGPAWSAPLYAAAGFAVALMLFSSPSSRKYVSLLLGAFFYEQRHAILSHVPTSTIGWIVGTLAIAITLGGLAAVLVHRRATVAAFNNTGPTWLNRLIDNRTTLSLTHYVAATRKITLRLLRLSLVVALYLAGSVAVGVSDSFFIAQGFLILGLLAGIALFTLPDAPNNIRHFFEYWYIPNKLGTRFDPWRVFFERIGKPVKKGMRGAGLPWVFAVFVRVLPFHWILYLSCFPVLVYLYISRLLSAEPLGIALLVAMSFSPIAVGEISRGPQIFRSYYPALPGLLLLIGFTTSSLLKAEPSAPLWGIMGITVILSCAIWNVRVFIKDVWPARMAPALLARELERCHADVIYTYDTPYNDAFVRALPPRVLSRLRIHFIKSLDEISSGYVVVPGTSSKAFNMESQRYAIERGDFEEDPRLLDLLKTKEIAKAAIRSFKTFGTSKIWVHESEVTSYRYLTLREVTDEDRWRGQAWLLDASKLPGVRST